MPLYFLPEYARQSALLSKNSSSSLSYKTKAVYVYEEGYGLVKLLSLYSSGGRLPTTMLSAYGSPIIVDLSWTNPGDIDMSILEARKLCPIRKILRTMSKARQIKLLRHHSQL